MVMWGTCYLVHICKYKMKKTQDKPDTHRKQNHGCSWLKNDFLPCTNVKSVNFVTPPFQNCCDQHLIWMLKCYLQWHFIFKIDTCILKLQIRIFLLKSQNELKWVHIITMWPILLHNDSTYIHRVDNIYEYINISNR